MEVMFERVAGIDIGKATLAVCVRTPAGGGRRHSETRTFKTTTGSLLVMRDWLLECGVTIAASESTYWKGCFYCLEDHMEVGCSTPRARMRCRARNRPQKTRSGLLNCWSKGF